MAPTPDAKTGPVRLADIRCETCEHFEQTMAHVRYGHCGYRACETLRSFGCIRHPLWQQALTEEQKGGSDAKSE